MPFNPFQHQYFYCLQLDKWNPLLLSVMTYSTSNDSLITLWTTAAEKLPFFKKKNKQTYWCKKDPPPTPYSSSYALIKLRLLGPVHAAVSSNYAI